MIISDNRKIFHLRRIDNLVKHQNVTKYCQNERLHIFLLDNMSLLTTKLVKTIIFRLEFSLSFEKHYLSNKLETFLVPNFNLSEKKQKSSYQVSEIFGLFLPLNCSNFRSKRFLG